MPGLLPLWATLFTWLISGERAGSQRLFGLALIVTGALLVEGLALSSALDGGKVWSGDLLYLFTPLSWAVFTSLCRRWEVGPVEATTGVSLFFAVALGLPYLIALLAGWVMSGLAIASASEILTQALLQGVMGVFVSGIGFMKMVQGFGSVRATMLTAMVPAIAAGSAVLFLDEPFTGMLGAGLICITLGIIAGVGGSARVAVKPGA